MPRAVVVELAIRLGMEFNLTLHAPLMYQTKRETVALAQALGALEALAYTHTCYNGQQPPLWRMPRLPSSGEGIRRGRYS